MAEQINEMNQRNPRERLYCENCAAPLSPSARICIKCGTFVNNQTSDKKIGGKKISVSGSVDNERKRKVSQKPIDKYTLSKKKKSVVPMRSIKDDRKEDIEEEILSSRVRRINPLKDRYRNILEKKRKTSDSSSEKDLSDTAKLRLDLVQAGYTVTEKDRITFNEYKRYVEKAEKEEKTNVFLRGVRRFREFWRYRNPINGVLLVLLLAATLIFVVGGLTVFRYAQAQVQTADSVINTFETAVKNNDYTTLSSMLTTTDSRLVIDENSLKPLFRKINENPEYANTLVTELKQDTEQFAADDDYESKNLIRMKKTGGSFFGLDEYEIEIQSIYVDSIIPPGNRMSIDGIEFKTTTEQRDIPFVPGSHIMTLTSGALEVSNKIDFSADNTSYSNGRIRIDYDKVSLTQVTQGYELREGEYRFEIRSIDQDREAVFVNGLSTGMTVRQFNEFGDKNLKEGDNVQIVVKRDWGLASSPPHILDGGKSARLRIDNFSNLNQL